MTDSAPSSFATLQYLEYQMRAASCRAKSFCRIRSQSDTRKWRFNHILLSANVSNVLPASHKMSIVLASPPTNIPSLDSSLPFSIHLSIHLPTFLLLLDCSLNKLLVIEQLLPAVLVLAIYPRCSAFCATNTSVLWFVATLLVMPPKILIHHPPPPRLAHSFLAFSNPATPQTNFPLILGNLRASSKDVFCHSYRLRLSPRNIAVHRLFRLSNKFRPPTCKQFLDYSSRVFAILHTLL